MNPYGSCIFLVYQWCRPLINQISAHGIKLLVRTRMGWRGQIANFVGIHGRPYLPYGNVMAKAGDEDNGYCTHVSILFPTWHRPYLALYEVWLPSLIMPRSRMLTSNLSKSYIVSSPSSHCNILQEPSKINTYQLLIDFESPTGIGQQSRLLVRAFYQQVYRTKPLQLMAQLALKQYPIHFSATISIR